MQEDKLSPELEELVRQLAFLDDMKLLRLSHSTFQKKPTARIRVLHYKQQSVGLSDSDEIELAELMNKLSRWFVSRNMAMGVLLDRGYPASEFYSKE